MMTLITSPKNVLEIGTATGFSGLFIARALKDGAKLTTIERSAPSLGIAKENFARAGVGGKVYTICGDALKVLPALTGNQYDMAFIDAQKEEYEEYLTHVVKLMPAGGVIIIDNLLWHGQAAGGPLISAKYEESAKALIKFNKHFLGRRDLSAAILPVGDGIGLAVVM